MNDPGQSIDTFIAEVDEMKKEEEKSSAVQEELKSSAQEELRAPGANQNNNNNNVDQHQPMTAELIQEKIKRGEIFQSEIL